MDSGTRKKKEPPIRDIDRPILVHGKKKKAKSSDQDRKMRSLQRQPRLCKKDWER